MVSKVEATNGKVILSGVVDSYWEKKRIHIIIMETGSYKLSILWAIIKSFSDNPLMACVDNSITTLP